MRDFGAGVERIDRRHDATKSRDCVKRDGVLRAIWTQDADDLALAETTLGQVVGDNGDRVGQLREGDGAAGWTVDQRRFVSEFRRALHDKRSQGSFGNLYVRIGTFEYHLQFFGRVTGFDFAHTLTGDRACEKAFRPRAKRYVLAVY